MKMFAGETTLKLLSRLGMKEGDAIENPMLTKAISRAQRKVEERNFLSRKNLLEWDEVLNAQRHEFYDMRQAVLENRGIKQLIFEHIEESVSDAVDRFLDRNYVATCISEWVHEHVNVQIEPERFRGKDREDLHNYIANAGAGEAARMIEVTIGEYMPTDIDLGEGTIERTDRSMWNLVGLADWANTNFDAGVGANDLLDKEPREVMRMLEVAAAKYVEGQDLSPLDRYLVPNYGATELCKWAKNKFGAELDPEVFVGLDKKGDAFSIVMKRAHEVYRQREITYPIEFALDSTSAMIQHDPQVALTQFTKWVNARYELGWSPHALPSSNPAELRAMLVAEAEKWDESRISERADRAVQQSSSPEELNAWFQENMGAKLTDDELARAADDPMSVAEEKIAKVLRAELTQFERWVLLQIVDQAWKDHLHAIDQLRESIGFRSFSQRDPRIEFKREGAAAFAEMFETIRDKVTELVFKAKLTPQVRAPEPTDAGGGGAPPAGEASQAAPTPVTAGAPSGGGGASRTDAAPMGQTNREPESSPRRAPVRVQGAI
ncbi:MAG: hypothetical protein KC983_12510, partial [Phycisphaerales bacterium]|nr:hypothetical protein [Phycisphaerales bacterium]